jgi:hypothetical protein
MNLYRLRQLISKRVATSSFRLFNESRTIPGIGLLSLLLLYIDYNH